MEQRNSRCKIKNSWHDSCQENGQDFWPEFSPAHKDLDIHSLSTCYLKLSQLMDIQNTQKHISMFGIVTTL